CTSSGRFRLRRAIRTAWTLEPGQGRVTAPNLPRRFHRDPLPAAVLRESGAFAGGKTRCPSQPKFEGLFPPSAILRHGGPQKNRLPRQANKGAPETLCLRTAPTNRCLHGQAPNLPEYYQMPPMPSRGIQGLSLFVEADPGSTPDSLMYFSAPLRRRG